VLSSNIFATFCINLIKIGPVHRHIKYSLDFLRQITTAEALEAVDWLAELPQQTWPQAVWSSDVIFVEVNSRSLGGGHVCWGSYDGFNFAGWRGGCARYRAFGPEMIPV